jgi:hypothetical protein
MIDLIGTIRNDLVLILYDAASQLMQFFMFFVGDDAWKSLRLVLIPCESILAHKYK